MSLLDREMRGRGMNWIGGWRRSGRGRLRRRGLQLRRVSGCRRCRRGCISRRRRGLLLGNREDMNCLVLVAMPLICLYEVGVSGCAIARRPILALYERYERIEGVLGPRVRHATRQQKGQ